ncbi:hypothetical protein [Clostridium sp. BJN0001]|uniref:hypothetical protein n=1 Tax=Clostridium sp. BJN0001 TaxID=2930219 RepID=UPI001FD5EF24|nr:hypothetical protein [Clostridium sp. BJN0001]
MEFKLNQIDTDIRRKMQEEVKEDKVHSSKDSDGKGNIIKDKRKNNESKSNDRKNENKGKRFITVDGFIPNKNSIRIEAQKLENLNEDDIKGTVLDTKK